MKLFVSGGDIAHGTWYLETGGVMRNHTYKQQIQLNDHLTSVQVVQATNDRTISGTASAAALGTLVAGPLGAIAGAAYGGKRDKEAVVACELSDGSAFVAKFDGGYLGQFLGYKTGKPKSGAVVSEIPAHIQADHYKGMESKFKEDVFMWVAGILLVTFFVSRTLFWIALVLAALVAGGIGIMVLLDPVRKEKKAELLEERRAQVEREAQWAKDEAERERETAEEYEAQKQFWDEEQLALAQDSLPALFEARADKLADVREDSDPELQLFFTHMPKEPGVHNRFDWVDEIAGRFAFQLGCSYLVGVYLGPRSTYWRKVYWGEEDDDEKADSTPPYTFPVDLVKAKAWMTKGLTLICKRYAALDDPGRLFMNWVLLLEILPMIDPFIPVSTDPSKGQPEGLAETCFNLSENAELCERYLELLRQIENDVPDIAALRAGVRKENAEYCKKIRSKIEKMESSKRTWRLAQYYFKLAEMHIVGVGAEPDFVQAEVLYDRAIELADELYGKKSRQTKVDEFTAEKLSALKTGRVLRDSFYL